MHSGQRGAAHVNVFFFLIMLVLFLGALGFAYVTLSKNTELEQRIAAAETKVRVSAGKDRLIQHYLEDVAKEIGERGEYAGRDGFTYEGNPAPLQNVAVPARIKATMTDFANAVRVPVTAELSSLFGIVKGQMDKVEEISANMATQKATIENEVAALKTEIAEIKKSQKSAVDGLNAQIRQRTEDYTARTADLERTIAAGSQEYTRLREEHSDAVAQHQVTVGGLRKEMDTLGARIDAAADKVKLLNPAQSPDGMVIDASQATGLAWINLGRRDQLPIGTTFEVIKPGSDTVKAYATVSRLEQDRAEVRITGLKDQYDPVANGDMVRNDLYSPEMRHNIYLMGRFAAPMTRPTVSALLENLGNRVVDELGPGVDLILLGSNTINEDGSGFTPLTETEEYKLAQFLRIEMAPLSKVRQYLKLSDDTVPAR